ncbi:SDR family oxidoreductase [Microbulbifer echini]|uniref:SDR family oxidoreductase n=1 Tax=Microbulbifer echini TaxID=1529067 RepID=A0ABV4NSL4_9GAMM|nr:SDR family NAD(P)-dependent oxidoreductase [uncultured Microbulbifer sp.]
MNGSIFQEGHVAIISGGADGIGLAAAKKFASVGMKIGLIDLNEEKLSKALKDLPDSTLSFVVDVGNVQSLEKVKVEVVEQFGRIDLLMNNAGVGYPTKSWDNLDSWENIINTNFWGVVNSIHVFVPQLILQEHASLVINTGSKQGITTPPGNPAYNASKAAVKVVAEALEYQLRELSYKGGPRSKNNRIASHLLIPGFTYTGMISSPQKPKSAWAPDQVIDFMLERIEQGDFYILCPDNDVTREVDNKRIAWAAGDIIEDRPPLSRWHPDYADAFKKYMES